LLQLQGLPSTAPHLQSDLREQELCLSSKRLKLLTTTIVVLVQSFVKDIVYCVIVGKML